MKRILFWVTFWAVCGSFMVSLYAAEKREWPRSALWDPNPIQMVDTSKYKKKPPYVIGFANADISNPWAVFMDREVQAEAEKYPQLIKKLFVTDAQGKADKQINDVEDLYAKGIDILLIRAVTEAGLDPIITRLHKQGLPIITISKGTKSGNYTCFVASSNFTMGRLQVVWLAQMLKGKGNIVVLAGWAGAGSTEERRIGGYEALAYYPEIKVLDRQYTQYSASKGKEIMQAMIQTYGKNIHGVWCDSGIQGAGAMEALHAAGIKVPITGEPINSFMKRAQQWGYPAVAPGYPVSMGADAIKLALRVLQGTSIPYKFNAPRMLLATHETADIKSDGAWKDYAHIDKPDNWFPDHTLPEKWLPK